MSGPLWLTLPGTGDVRFARQRPRGSKPSVLALNGPIGRRSDRVASLEEAKAQLRVAWGGLDWAELRETTN